MVEIRERRRKPNPDIGLAFAIRLPPETPTINVPATAHCIMGIDASLTNTGIAVLLDGKLHTESLEPKKLRGAERLAWFRSEIRALLSVYVPTAVMLEGYAFGAKMQREAMGELGGVVRLTCWDASAPLSIVQPTCLKLFITGSGAGPKDNMSKEIYKRYGVDLTDNNQVDAAGLAIMGLATRTDMPLTEFQKRALSKLGE
jgi:Holliday junction resolvasome RuvABC endonuclease subunit